MTQYSASEARAKFNELLEAAKAEAVEIQKHGKPVAVMVDAVKYQQLLEYVEDLEDSIAVLQQKLDAEPGWQNWDEVKKDLGWE